MRQTVMNQMAKGLPAESELLSAAKTEKELERLKWNVWHGNVFRAVQRCQYLEMDLETLLASEEPSTTGITRLLKAVSEFRVYIEANKSLIPTCSDRYRNGKPILSAPAESMVNQVMSKRMVKNNRCGGVTSEHTCCYNFA